MTGGKKNGMIYILIFLLGVIVGGVGIMVIAVALAKGKDEEEPERIGRFCKDCKYAVPGNEDYIYYCEAHNCEIYGHTEACENYTD